jgi:hypothetical protein
MSNTTAHKGYAYRVRAQNNDGTFRGLSEQELRELIGEHIGSGTTFEGDTLKLIPPRPFANARDAEVLPLRGDFGHAFNARAEVRWRRGEQGGFEVLLLSESPLKQVPAGVDQIGAAWEVRPAASESPIIMTTPEEKSRAPRLGQMHYIAPEGESNGAVQFVRYTEVKL